MLTHLERYTWEARDAGPGRAHVIAHWGRRAQRVSTLVHLPRLDLTPELYLS